MRQLDVDLLQYERSKSFIFVFTGYAGGYDSMGGPGGSNAMSFGNDEDDRLVL